MSCYKHLQWADGEEGRDPIHSPSTPFIDSFHVRLTQQPAVPHSRGKWELPTTSPSLRVLGIGWKKPRSRGTRSFLFRTQVSLATGTLGSITVLQPKGGRYWPEFDSSFAAGLECSRLAPRQEEATGHYRRSLRSKTTRSPCPRTSECRGGGVAQ